MKAIFNKLKNKKQQFLYNLNPSSRQIANLYLQMH